MIQLPANIQKFMDIFTGNGYRIYVVGGAVRNLLLKKPVLNWDFTTNAKPEELKKRKVDLFQYSVILVGLAGFLFSLAILDTVYDFIIGPGCYSVKLSMVSRLFGYR